MSSEGSVAPKERVNIVYKSETNGVEEEVELPLKVLVAGEFLTDQEFTSIESRNKIRVNKYNFNEVMQKQNLKLDLLVENKMEENGGDMDVTLHFENIKDFEPDSIIEAVPELRKLLELREALKSLKGPLGNIPEFRKNIDKLIENKDIKDSILSELDIKDK